MLAIGTKVRIKSKKWWEAESAKIDTVVKSEPGFEETMTKYCGKIATIKSIAQYSYYCLEGFDYIWHEEYFDVIEEETMKKGDKVWVSDASEELAIKNRREGIFVANVGGDQPYIVVADGYAHLFPDGAYKTFAWEYAVLVQPVKVLTIKEAEDLIKTLGSMVKIKGD